MDKAQSTYWSRWLTNPPVTGWIYRVPVITELYTLHYVSQNRQRRNICVNAFLSHIQPQRQQTEDPSVSKRLFVCSIKMTNVLGFMYERLCADSFIERHIPNRVTIHFLIPHHFELSKRIRVSLFAYQTKEKKNQCLCLSSCHSNGRNVLRFHLFVRAWKFNFFRCACWHFGTLSLIYLCTDDKPLVYFMACVCCVMFEAPLVHMLSPRCRSFMLQMNRQDDLSVTLLFGAGGALAGCM